jgi:hypothetical protein
MIKFDLNIGQFFAITFANFFLSWFWYSKAAFGGIWARAVGMNMEAPMTDEQKKKMPMLMAGALIASFALSFGLQILIHSLGATEFGQGALIGVLCWLAFALSGSLGTLFEGRSAIVIQINNGLFLVTYALFGGILAAWH